MAQTLYSRLTRYGLDQGGLLALAILILYVWIAPAHIVDGDNAEFATLSATGGAAHPSGYPLYVLWLRAMSWLPGASPAHVSAIATAVVGAASMLVLHAACRAWGAKPLAATAAVALYAGAPVVLRVSTEAEVFALNGLLVGAVLWLSARNGPLRGYRRALALGLVAGFGLSNHLTCVLIAPLGVLGAIRAAREAPRSTFAVGLAIGGLMLGLTPYLYLLVAPETPMSWGAVRDLEGVVAMFTRQDYGGPTAFRAAGEDVSMRTSLAALARMLGRTWLWLPLALGALVLARASVRATDAETRRGWVLLGLSILLAGPLLVLRFNVPPHGLGLYVCQRFYLLPAMLFVIPISVGFNLIAALAGKRTQIAAVIVSTLGLAAIAGASLPYVARVHGPAVELSARNMLRSLPPNAVVIHGQDELHAATGYVQSALAERKDVLVVTQPLLSLPWYRARLSKQGIRSEQALVTLANHVLATGRPLFVDRLQREIIANFPTHPYGIVIRVLPRGEQVPSVLDVFELNKKLYADFNLDYAPPGPHDEYATEVHARYAAIWNMIGQKLTDVGEREAAGQAYQRARELAPRR